MSTHNASDSQHGDIARATSSDRTTKSQARVRGYLIGLALATC